MSSKNFYGLAGDVTIDGGILNVGNAQLYANTETSNVGIGTTNPGFKLDVNGAANVGVLYSTFLYGDGSNIENIVSSQWEGSPGDPIYYASNVGIGNTAPVTATLQIGANVVVNDVGTNVIDVTGNVNASYFVGDGSQLTGIAASLDQIVDQGNVVSNTIIIESGIDPVSNIGLVTREGVSISVSNANPSGAFQFGVGSNLLVNVYSSNVLTVDGNIFAQKMTLGTVTVLPAYNLEQITGQGAVSVQTMSLTNATTGLTTTANIVVGGNVTAESVITSGNINANNVITVANVNVGRDLSVTGNVYIDNMRVADVASNLVTYDSTTGELMDSGGLISNKLAIVSEQPPSALDGASTIVPNHGVYTIEASSGTVVNLFDKIIGESNKWESDGTYSTTSGTMGDYIGGKSLAGIGGEWAKITMPYKTILRHIRFESTNRSTENIEIVGLNDDEVTWTSLKVSTGVVDETHTVIVDASTYHRAYGLIVTKTNTTSGRSQAEIGDLRLFTESLSIDGGVVTMPASVTLGNLATTGNVVVNTDTLFVDTSTNSVGIGTATPSANLHVTGNVTIGSTLMVSGFRITAQAAAVDDLEAITTTATGALRDANKTTNAIHITNATKSTTPYTGALQVGTIDPGGEGGLGVAGNVHVGGGVYTSNLQVNGTTIVGGHIIPMVTDTYDLGSPECKFRDLFMSENSIWMGDTVKMSFENGRMKFKQRKLTIVPSVIVAAGGTTSLALAHAGKATLSDMKLEDWRNYAKTLDDSLEISTIFTTTFEDYDRQVAADAWNDSGDDIYTSNSVTIGSTDAPNAILHVTGNVYVSSNLEVGTANLFVDTVNSRVGIGTTEPTESLDIVGNVNLHHASNVASIKVNSSVVTEFPRSKKLIKYPRVALTGPNDGSGYVVTQNAAGTWDLSSPTNNRNAWALFDGISMEKSGHAGPHFITGGGGDRYNADGTYAGSDSLGGVSGDWVSIRLPEKIKIQFVKLWVRNVLRTPTDATVLGSLDGQNWNIIDSWNNYTSFVAGKSTKFTINANEYYDYIGFVFEKIGVNSSGKYNNFFELELFGTPENDPEANGVDVVVKSVPNVPNTDWLEVYYDAKNYTSGTITDESPNSYVGTLNSVTLDNSAIQSFDIPDGGNISATLTSIPSADFVHSVSVWVKFEGDTLTTSYPYLYFLGVNSNYSGFGLFFAGAARPNQLHVSCWKLDYPINFTFSNDTWHHVTYTYSGGGWSRNSTLNAYVDGIEYGFGDNWSTGTEGTTPTIATSNVPLRLGTVSTGGTFDGKIANFRLFNRALSSDEIYQLYAYQKEYFGHGTLGMTLKAGRLGIGTSEPQGLLDVRGNIYAPIFKGLNDSTVVYKYFDTETAVSTFSGLDLKVGEAYKIIWHYHNSVAAVNDIHLYINGDETDANYWHSLQYVTSTFASAGEAAFSAKILSTGANADHIVVYDLRISWDGYPMMLGHGHFSTPSATSSFAANEAFRLGTLFHKAKTSAITSLKFDAKTGNIGVGSSIRILKSM